mmetsp:Transcript_92398/g.238529  ORF Transcript_92398/g.238529 Transcript_92398/m.238529 type:complete len:481 (+) Transcript_92398:615-2057(+)
MKVNARLTVRLLLKIIAEGLGRKDRHDHRAKGIGNGVLQGTLPGHDPAARVGWHNLGENGEVGARLRPRADKPEGDDQREVDPEATVAREDAVEEQEDARDAQQHGDLRAERAPVVAELAGQEVSDEAGDELAKHARDGIDAGEHARFSVSQARQLEVQRHVAHDAPRDGAKDALHDHHAKGRDAEELEEARDLLQDSHANAPLTVDILLRRLLEQQHQQGGHHNREQTDEAEGDPPALDAQDVNACNGHRHQGCDEHAKEEGALDAAEDLATLRLSSHVRNDAVGDGTERREHRAVEGAQKDHGDHDGDHREHASHNALPERAQYQDGLAQHDATVRHDAPERRGKIREYSLGCVHVGEVHEFQADVLLKGQHRSRQERGVGTLQSCRRTEQELHEEARLPPVILHLTLRHRLVLVRTRGLLLRRRRSRLLDRLLRLHTSIEQRRRNSVAVCLAGLSGGSRSHGFKMHGCHGRRELSYP